MNIELQAIVRELLRRTRTLTSRIDLPLNSEDSRPGEAGGAILKMREVEQELLLSPLFTPDQEERSACEAALPPRGLNPEEVGELVAALSAETLSFPAFSGGRDGFCPLPDVVLTRYIHLLGLDRSVDQEAAGLIEASLAGQDRRMVMSLARRPVWQSPASRELLLQLLRIQGSAGALSVGKLEFLTGFARTYRTTSAEELIRALKSLLESYRIDSEHPTFNNPALETKQGESIRSEHCDEAVKQYRVTMAREILEDFGKFSAPP
ncbi:MAG: hypothetical protein HQL95_09870 [Magnetococcales bacterium]|nr:hypothetical protein [Magnetococcales bacterium]